MLLNTTKIFVHTKYTITNISVSISVDLDKFTLIYFLIDTLILTVIYLVGMTKTQTQTSRQDEKMTSQQQDQEYTLYCHGDGIDETVYAASDSEAVTKLKEWAGDAVWGGPLGHEIQYTAYRQLADGSRKVVGGYTQTTTEENTYF